MHNPNMSTIAPTTAANTITQAAGNNNSQSASAKQQHRQQQPQPQQQQPKQPKALLSLRMRCSRSMPPSERDVSSIDELGDRLQVMMAQEESTTYRCNDYLARRKAATATPASHNNNNNNNNNSENSTPTPTPPTMKATPTSPTSSSASLTAAEVDTLCREKMCEWSYRVVDHFHASREIVALAFNYLDRFVDRCSCDRTAFKLAAMTAVYMATKVFNSREISMSSLAELSRGEFALSHIEEMEGVMLETLQWRVNPPTVQCFIHQMHRLVPVTAGPVTRAIHQRASFFAELALFDYCFVTQPRSAVAIAALLNAMEGMDETIVPKGDHDIFLQIVAELTGQTYPRETIDAIRNRLWYIYSQSAQYQEDEVVAPSAQQPTNEKSFVEKDLLAGDQSPVCVSVVTKHS